MPLLTDGSLSLIRARCERAEVFEVTEDARRRRRLHGPVFLSILREMCTRAGVSEDGAAPPQLSV